MCLHCHSVGTQLCVLRGAPHLGGEECNMCSAIILIALRSESLHISYSHPCAVSKLLMITDFGLAINPACSKRGSLSVGGSWALTQEQKGRCHSLSAQLLVCHRDVLQWFRSLGFSSAKGLRAKFASCLVTASSVGSSKIFATLCSTCLHASSSRPWAPFHPRWISFLPCFCRLVSAAFLRHPASSAVQFSAQI